MTLIINYVSITIFCMQNTVYFTYINIINIQLISIEKVYISLITKTHNWSVLVKRKHMVFMRIA